MKKNLFLAVVFLISVSLSASEGNGSEFPGEQQPGKEYLTSPLCVRRVKKQSQTSFEDPDKEIKPQGKKMLEVFGAQLQRKRLSSVSSDGSRSESSEGK